MLKVTVITVCYNARHLLESTIQSVLGQSYPDIEYIVIDGGSSDGSLDIIQKYGSRISVIVSEPDKGIYDAMNKGIKLASGGWINFMNAGDTFVNDSVISNVFSKADESADVIYGDNILIYPENSIYHSGKYFSKNDINLPFCHQSAFVRSDLAKQTPFDLRYKVAADFNFFYHLHKLGKKFIHIPIAISNYDMQGFSQKNVIKTFDEVHRIQGSNSGIRFFLGRTLLKVKLGIRQFVPNKFMNGYRKWRHG